MADKPACASIAADSARCTELQAALDRAMAEREALAQELWESKRFAAELAISRQQLADELAQVRAVERAAAEAAAMPLVATSPTERDAAVAARDLAVQERDAALVARNDALALLDRMRASTSWRLTAPLRRATASLLGRSLG